MFVKEAENINKDFKERLKAFVGGSEDVRDYAIDNEYIIRGYRINHNTNGRSIKSIFVCHNETVNIWTHLLGALTFAVICFIIMVYQNLDDIGS